MTSWLGLSPWFFLFGALAVAALLVGAALLGGRRRRRRPVAVRRRVLAQLALAVRRGVPLDRALGALAGDLRSDRRGSGVGRLATDLLALVTWSRWSDERESRRQADVVEELARTAREGSLGGALRRHPDVFPPPMDELLGVAEREGNLAATLDELLRLEAEVLALRRSLLSQLLYPVLLFLALLGPIAFVALAIEPKFEEIARSLARLSGEPAQFPTLEAARRLLLVLVPALLLGMASLPVLLGARRGRLVRALRERVPGVGTVLRGLRRVRFARLLRASLLAGVPLPDALRALEPLGAVTDPEEEPEGAGAVRFAGWSGTRLGYAAARAGEGSGLAASLGAAGALSARDLELLAGWAGDDEQGLELLARVAGDEGAAAARRLAGLILPLGLLAVGALAAVQYWLPWLYVEAQQKVLIPPW